MISDFATFLGGVGQFCRTLPPFVKWDKWSHCKREGTGNRDGDYTANDRHYQGGGYDATAFLDKIDSYQSAYHEPVLVLRYMELEDPGQGFQGVYNNQVFEQVYQPSDVYVMNVNFGSFYGHLGWMEGRLYKDDQLVPFKFLTTH